MANITTYLENQLLEHSLGKTTFDKPTSTHAALFTTSPSISSAGVEVTNSNNYARQPITWGSALNGQISNSAVLTWSATGSWSGGSSITSIGIYDSGNYGSGNLLYYGPLSAALTMTNGDTFNISIGSLKVALA